MYLGSGQASFHNQLPRRFSLSLCNMTRKPDRMTHTLNPSNSTPPTPGQRQQFSARRGQKLPFPATARIVPPPQHLQTARKTHLPQHRKSYELYIVGGRTPPHISTSCQADIDRSGRISQNRHHSLKNEGDASRRPDIKTKPPAPQPTWPVE